MHIWQTGSENRFLSAHLVVKEADMAARSKILAKIIKSMKEKFDIHHSTLQMVSEQEMKEIGLDCEHCN
jgi:cobalt-zinc-cadmium efflux system protein